MVLLRRSQELEAQLYGEPVIAMQNCLFRTKMAREACSDAVVSEILLQLRELDALAGFRIWLIGSRLEPDNVRSDIDILLTPMDSRIPDDIAVEQALWSCRSHGLNNDTQRVAIDPSYRQEGSAKSVSELSPDQLLTTTKLLCPRFQSQAFNTLISDFCFVGSCCIRFRRRAIETSYFAKLPLVQHQGKPVRQLRTAREISGSS